MKKPLPGATNRRPVRSSSPLRSPRAPAEAPEPGPLPKEEALSQLSPSLPLSTIHTHSPLSASHNTYTERWSSQQRGWGSQGSLPRLPPTPSLFSPHKGDNPLFLSPHMGDKNPTIVSIEHHSRDYRNQTFFDGIIFRPNPIYYMCKFPTTMKGYNPLNE